MPSSLYDGSKGEWVWIYPRDGKQKVHPRAAQITKMGDTAIDLQITVGDEETDQEFAGLREMQMTYKEGMPFRLNRMAQNCIDGVDNMIELGDLHEGSLLHNLRHRFKHDQIYTYVGQILVCVNPYINLGYTTDDWKKKYKRQGMDNKALSPHPFAVADHVYNCMMKSIEGGPGLRNQSVVISGESGAGKTVTTGHVLQYLTHVTGKQSVVQDQILESGLMLETFGNAKTMRNNNSSRFGKFIEVLFDNDGQIVGAEIQHYLLEKSRVQTQSLGERNYHAFYHLFQGWTKEEQASHFLLKPRPEDYSYLNQSGVALVDPSIIPDKEDNEITRKAMQTLRFSPEMQETIWQIVAAVLHIGNIKFEPRPMDQSAVTNMEEVEAACKLLKLDQATCNYALLKQILVIEKKTVDKFFTPREAVDNAGAFAKAIYSGMFDWIMEELNNTMRGAGSSNCAGWIGVLDIFGFEHFYNKPRPIGSARPEAMIPNNHFEQFCINFANERLQNFFNKQIFEMEKKVLQSEGIPLADFRFKNNDKCIELIDDKDGILDILNDISKPRPVRGWKDFRGELMNKFCKAANWVPNPEVEVDVRTDKLQYVDKVTNIKWNLNNTDFIIHHYAAPVQYTAGSDDSDACADFVTKNKDKLTDDLRALIEASANPLISTLLTHKVGKGGGVQTVGKIFSDSLKLLINTLASTEAIFVRTVKPNGKKTKRLFEDYMVLEQLRCAGMLETIKIRKMGYPRKSIPEDFLKDYQILVNMDEIKGMDATAAALYIITKFCVQTPQQEELNGKLFCMGMTKLFYKDRAYTMLEDEKDKRLKELQKLKDKAMLLLRCMYRTYVMQVKLPQIEAEYRKVQKWNEEKLRRMRENPGKSADEIEREMLEELRVEEENKYKSLVVQVVDSAQKEADFAMEQIGECKSAIKELMDDNTDPPWPQEQKDAFKERIHELEMEEMAVNDALHNLRSEYSSQKPNLVGYNESLRKLAIDKIKHLKHLIATNLDSCIKEKGHRHTIIQKEIERKEKERERAEQAKREEEARKAREKALEEERARIRKIEQEEAERRSKLEEKQRLMQAELDKKRKRRDEEKLSREQKIEQRRAQFRMKRAEMAKQEKLTREQREFEQTVRQQEEDFVERTQLEDKEYLRKKKEAEENLKRAQTSALETTRVLYGKMHATVKYVGTLPFYAAGPWIGIECAEHIGSTPGNNGMVMGQRFFECVQGHGLFVRGEMLHILEDEPVKHGSLVNWEGYLGRVRYMGPVHFEGGDNWVGIELDEEKGRNDGTVMGREYFRCRKNRGVMTRISNIAAVKQWTVSFVDNATQNYIIQNDLDLFAEDDQGDDAGVAEAELMTLEMQEAEQRLRERYGAEFKIAEFDPDNFRPVPVAAPAE